MGGVGGNWMRCLVLGGNGFIGSHIVDALVAAGHPVRVFDLRPGRFHEPVAGVDYQYGNWEDLPALEAAVTGMDVVFHLIATTIPATSNQDMVYDVRSNVLNSLLLFQTCVEQGAKKVVFASSGGSVYGIPRHNPIPETHPTDPLSSHGIAKLMVEKYLALFHRLYSLDYVIVRASNAYGERQDPWGRLGAITVFLGKTARGEPIEVWGDGSVIRDYIHVGDVAKAYVQLAEANLEDHVFNVGSSEGHSLNDILRLIHEVTGRIPQVRYTPGRPFDVPANVLDIGRICSAVPWKPLIPLRTGIERTWGWVRDTVTMFDTAVKEGLLVGDW
jgi:UDP-glucose 4-epimerase